MADTSTKLGRREAEREEHEKHCPDCATLFGGCGVATRESDPARVRGLEHLVDKRRKEVYDDVRKLGPRFAGVAENLNRLSCELSRRRGR